MTTDTREERQDCVDWLYEWYKGNGSNFMCKLYELIAKADLTNRARIAQGFPLQVECYEQWHASKLHELDWFRENGLRVP